MPVTTSAVLQRLALLTDAEALALAKKVGRAAQTKTMFDALDAELRKELEAVIGETGAPKQSQEQAARAALVWMANAKPTKLDAYMKAAEVQSLVVIGAVTAALVILQTEVTIKRDAKGKWTVKLSKGKSSDGLLKGFIKAILGAA